MRYCTTLMVALICTTPSLARADVPDDGCIDSSSSLQSEALTQALAEGAVIARLQALTALSEAEPNNELVHFHLAKTHFENGSHAEALIHAHRGASLDSSCEPMALLWSQAAKAQGDIPGETAALLLLVRQDPSEVDYRTRLVELMVGQSDLEGAEPHARYLASLPGASAEQILSLADIEAWQGHDEGALKHYTKARALDESAFNGERWFQFGEAARRRGQPALAIECYDGAIAQLKVKNPSYLGALLGLGWAYSDIQRHDQASQAFLKAHKLRPQDAGICASVARSLHKMGQTEQGIPYFEKSLALKEDRALRFEAAQVTASVEPLRPKALKLFQPLVNGRGIAADHGLAYLKLLSWMPEQRSKCHGFYEELMGQSLNRAQQQEAKAIVRQAILWTLPSPELLPSIEGLLVSMPGDLELNKHLIACLMLVPDRRRDAIEAMSRVLAQAPNETQLRLQRAELMAESSDANYAHLTGELQRVTSEIQGDADSFSRVAYLYLKINALDLAYGAFEKTLMADPSHCDGAIGQGETLAALDREREAISAFERALRQCKGSTTQKDLKNRIKMLNLATTLEDAARLGATDQWQSAVPLYKGVLKVVPEDMHTWVALGALYAAHGQFEDALGAFRQALSIESKHLGALQGASGAALALHRYDDAEGYLKQELAVAPSDNVRARLASIQMSRELESARMLVGDGAYDAALAGLAQLYLSRPDDGEIALLYGETLFATKRLTESVEAYRRAVRLLPSSYRAARGGANALWQSGRREEARRMLDHAISLASPSDALELRGQAMYWNLEEGELAKAKGEHTRALNFFRRAYHYAPSDIHVLMALGGLYWSNGQLPLASKYFVRGTQLYPEDAACAKAASETLLAQDRVEQVYDLLKDSPARQYPAVEALFRQAVLARDLRAVEEAWQRGERAIAASVAETIAKDYPGKLEPWRQLARLSLREGRYLDALSFFQRALTVNPNSESDLYGVIATLQTIGRHAEAAQLIVQARARQQVDALESSELDRLEASGWVARGEAHKRVGEYQAAVESYRTALQLSPGESWILAGLGGLYLINGQIQESLEIYNYALTRNALEIEALRGRAACLLTLERVRQAAVDIEQIEALEGNTQRVLLLKAELAKQRGDVKEALTLYERIFYNDPDSKDAFVGLVGAYLSADNASAALELVSRNLERYHSELPVLRMAGGALRALGRSDLAVPVYRRIAISWPSERANEELMRAFVGAYVEAAEDARLRGDIRQAELLYDEALEKAPGSGEILRAMAALDARAGRYGDALDRFELALINEPDDPWGIIGRANVLAAQGSRQRALSHLEEGWERTQDVWVGLHYARLLIDLQRLGAAERQLSEVEELSFRQKTVRQEAYTQANHTGHSLSDSTVVSHFMSAWTIVARQPVILSNMTKSLPLPVISADELQQLPMGEATRLARGLQLEDVDPTLSVAVLAIEPQVNMALSRSVVQEEVDLAALDRLLAELRQAPKTDERTKTYPTDRPILTFEGVGTQIETLQPGDVPQVSALAYEVDAFAPFRPTISERRALEQQVKAEAQDPEHFARQQRRRLNYEKASRLSIGGGVDARTGSAGTTALVAAAGEARLDILPVPSFDIFAFVRPEVVSNLIDAQEGVSIGGGTAFQAGAVSVEAQVGTSPIGFLTDSQLIGFAKVNFSAIPHISLELEVAREPIKDSLLSYAGLSDAVTGEAWGRVARTRASATARLDMDNRAQLNLGGDYAWYDGLGVEENLWAQGRVDFRYRVWSEAEKQKVHIGVDTQFFAFSEQLDQFEPGYGGYFSPELFVMARGRLWYTGRLVEDRLFLTAHGGIGGQYTVGEDTLYMAPGLRPAVMAGLRLNYRLGPSVELDLRYDFDNAGADYTRNTLWVSLHKRFGVEAR